MVRFHAPDAPRDFARNFESFLAFMAVVSSANLLILNNLLHLRRDALPHFMHAFVMKEVVASFHEAFLKPFVSVYKVVLSSLDQRATERLLLAVGAFVSAYDAVLAN